MKKKLMKKILNDMAVLKEAGVIAKDKVRLEAVKELMINIRTGKTTINVKNLKGGIHL